MRIGQNPAKFVSEVAKPAEITVAVLNYIPFLSGFYTEALDVLKASLESARTEAGLPFDLLVFDNGSCHEVQDWLLGEQRAGRIQYLLLSEKNLGKGGAWNFILNGAPGSIIAYGDSDVLYYPGWLQRSYELLIHFPNVGMVTARPFRTNPDYYSATAAWAQADPEAEVETGSLIPWETILEFDLSLGQEEADIRRRYDIAQDVRLTYRGVQAFAGGSHWQFMAKKEVLNRFLPFSMDRPMGQVKQLDERVNASGLLRLMPTHPFAMNMSNSLRGVNPTAHPKARFENHRRPLLDFPPIRRVLLSLYDSIFRWYYDR